MSHLDFNQTREQILALENVNDKISALDRLRLIEEAERNQQLLELTRSVNEANQTHSLTRATLHVPFYDGVSLPLKEFLQDVDNGLTLVPAAQEPYYLRHVISRLKGKARESLEGLTFDSVSSLKSHLKSCFAPVKSYGHYLREIQSTAMRQGETVRQFHGRLNSLINSAVAAISEGIPGNQAAANHRPHLELLALEAFINGLPDGWRMGLADSGPQTLAEAFNTALRYEKARIRMYNDNQVYPRMHYAYSTTPSNSKGEGLSQEVDLMSQPEPNQFTYKEPRKVNFHDKAAFKRNQIPYSYDPTDVYFPRTNYDDGYMNAPPQLRYGTGENVQQPVSILKKMHPSPKELSAVAADVNESYGHYPPGYMSPYHLYPPHPYYYYPPVPPYGVNPYYPNMGPYPGYAVPHSRRPPMGPPMDHGAAYVDSHRPTAIRPGSPYEASLKTGPLNRNEARRQDAGTSQSMNLRPRSTPEPLREQNKKSYAAQPMQEARRQ